MTSEELYLTPDTCNAPSPRHQDDLTDLLLENNRNTSDLTFFLPTTYSQVLDTSDHYESR
jgi:hypothetical protein